MPGQLFSLHLNFFVRAAIPRVYSSNTLLLQFEFLQKYFSDFCITYRRGSLSMPRGSGLKATKGVSVEKLFN
jgi:hypothetical protein